ncbi:MAG TPA: hypothetical protein VH165_37715 [Kofleriaceae bacterium]|jgi:hypothetical protein|nr:hypothetical protein [Kofleriaceae bacterium]
MGVRTALPVWLGVFGSLVPAAGAEPGFVAERAIVVGHVDRGAWSDAATEARADQPAELAAVVVGHRGRRRVVLAPAEIKQVALGGQAIATEPLDDAARVQWSTVEPHGFRTEPAKNGVTSDFYSNVSTTPRSYGRWVGFDHIDYFERVIAAWGAPAKIGAQVTSGEDGAQALPGLGTVRFKVEVELPGGDAAQIVASPGAEATDTFGMLPSVHRVSIRRGDDFLGWLSSFLLVPEVFGSAGGGVDNQTDRFVGADCADVMVGALRRMGRTDLAYTNVAGLPSYARTIAGPTELDDKGMPAAPITGIAEGDLIRIRYGGEGRHHETRSWDHVAALWQDRSDPDGPFHGGPDGRLDGFDLIIHMGHPRLKIEPLSGQAPVTIDVLRIKPR